MNQESIKLSKHYLKKVFSSYWTEKKIMEDITELDINTKYNIKINDVLYLCTRKLSPTIIFTYFKKYLWPEDVFAISQPAGRGTSSGISKEDCLRCWAVGVAAGPETTPVGVNVPGDTAPSCREAGEEWARTCCGVRAPAVPASVLAY